MAGRYESPHIRRLRSDLNALLQLQDESSIFTFDADGKPARHYVLHFQGKGLMRMDGKVGLRSNHDVEIKLGSSYPRTIPEVRWLTPLYHPNVSEIGMVCLGAYGTHWAPSLMLDELCTMLWDIARYHNYDLRSPYNREAALWASSQTKYAFPLDSRPLRDLRAALGRVEAGGAATDDILELDSDREIAGEAGAFHEPPQALPELEIRLELDDEDERAVQRSLPSEPAEIVFLD